MKRFIAYGAFAATIALAAGPLLADSMPQVHLHGEVAAVTGQSFELQPAAGTKAAVEWNAKTRFASLSPAKLSDIKPGLFVGTAAIPQADGTLKAVEVHIFPESMRGTGEGYRPFPQVPQGTMTNATVTNITDAKGTSTAGADGAETLTLTYKDGHQTVVVPKGVPIVLIGKADASMLKPDAKVSVTGTKNAGGKLDAARIMIGLDGVMPPI